MKFIDLFAGIGGFRLGLERIGWECVFSAENDDHACSMYKDNYNENPECDVSKLDPKDIPQFDVLCAGFPCQTFSISGKKEGFYDATRGTLFFDILRILDERRPKAFILENVKHLIHHDSGRTFDVMQRSLSELGYTVNHKVLNAKDFGVPQNRERIIIIGNLEGFSFDFNKLKTTPVSSMSDFLDKEGDFEFLNPNEYTLIDDKYVKKQKSGLIFVGYRNKNIRKAGVRPGTEHLSRTHKQPNRIYSSKGNHPTLASQETSGRYFIQLDDGRVRKLTINEVFRFMGFPDDFKKTGRTGNLYARVGNSVCVPMVEEIGRVLDGYLRGEIVVDPVRKKLEEIYEEALLESNKISIKEKLDKEQHKLVESIIKHEERSKAVFTVLTSSLFYKILHPDQDVRYHQVELDNGYSGRSFDTKHMTPFLKEKRFRGAMKESGWLTRSLEQPFPYTLNYQGKIQNKNVKESFLNILDDVEEKGASPKSYLLNLFLLSVEEKKKGEVVLINPVDKDYEWKIHDIVSLLRQHFYYNYATRGASILPVIAIQSVYEILIEEMERFKDKELMPLGSHYSSDKNSGLSGDVVVKTQKGEEFEVVEIKHDIEIDPSIVKDVYKKIRTKPIQRYYILSTKEDLHREKEILEVINEIEAEHGCQVIVNGVMNSLKYYLRLLNNTDKFLKIYTSNLQTNTELDREKLIAWNIIVNDMKKNK